MAKFKVSFLNGADADLFSIEVDCYRITNAPKLAAKLLTEEQEQELLPDHVWMKVEPYKHLEPLYRLKEKQ